MGNHSYWCDVSKNAPCDCGFEELKQARSILLEVYDLDFIYQDNRHDRYRCIGCDSSTSLYGKSSIVHQSNCISLKVDSFLERYAPKD